jgi:hypothetical protein
VWAFLGDKSTVYIRVTFSESIGFYCDYLIPCVSCTVVALTFVMCGCFGNVCNCTRAIPKSTSDWLVKKTR